ncbi:hypothetical protein [Acinetobacter baumannii]|uniref:hypothetical protein n=2 Tax=Acinetobacter baumannii TaxID=470 RepID=UPI00105A1FB0|nr:hypothetical protein [Acinetobacter baumannii]MCD9082477.1 hypothetical protein [Acinetobacter baumannii]MCV7483812.1 hypothetical protein [Acinetobacter baumannii]TDH88259.1 hypothetical protein DWA15_19205 [Acinetobacter baumannii]TDI03097.1 hypothetical protein DWA14_07350 [Acinetobacter baumannii]WFT03049.1 hypothetical protein MTS08_16375 [Acinetobacter baumannii]
MNEQILAQNSICASPDVEEDQVFTQWQVDHDAYVETLDAYREAHTDLEKALGIEKDFDKTSHSAKEIIEDLRKNGHLYALINRFEDAVINRLRAKDKL